MTDQTTRRVQTAIGLLASLVFLVLAGLSMMPNYELTVPVIVGSIVVIGMLLGKIDAIANLVESWRGR